MNTPDQWSAFDVTLHNSDCRQVMAGLEDASIDAVCTDPPYGLGFMGKEWDSFDTAGAANGLKKGATGHAHSHGLLYNDPKAFQVWCEEWALECFRVLKPGGHLLAFGGTRTYHRLVCAIEDAGFEIRDSLHWIYGSGFPKSLDVSKAIDKAAGAEREITGPAPYTRGRAGQQYSETRRVSYDYPPQPVTVPATEDAICWEGWGTALKPAHEPIVLARKPLVGTVAQNVLEHGAGALNVDGCRVGSDSRVNNAGGASSLQRVSRVEQGYRPSITESRNESSTVVGRWPPNVLLTHTIDCQATGTTEVRTGTAYEPEAGRQMERSIYGATKNLGRVQGYADVNGLETVTAYDCASGCPVSGLDGQSGKLTSGANTIKRTSGKGGTQSASIGAESRPDGAPMIFYGDTGGASRFFPQLNWSPQYDLPFMYKAKAPKSERPTAEGVQSHPTVKPLALMRWLVRLITPPGGVVLDPFCGTGTTLQAARMEGFKSIGCDNWDDAIALAKVRLGFTVAEGMLF